MVNLTELRRRADLQSFLPFSSSFFLDKDLSFLFGSVSLCQTAMSGKRNHSSLLTVTPREDETNVPPSDASILFVNNAIMVERSATVVVPSSMCEVSLDHSQEPTQMEPQTKKPRYMASSTQVCYFLSLFLFLSPSFSLLHIRYRRKRSCRVPVLYMVEDGITCDQWCAISDSIVYVVRV